MHRLQWRLAVSCSLAGWWLQQNVAMFGGWGCKGPRFSSPRICFVRWWCAWLFDSSSICSSLSIQQQQQQRAQKHQRQKSLHDNDVTHFHPCATSSRVACKCSFQLCNTITSIQDFYYSDQKPRVQNIVQQRCLQFQALCFSPRVHDNYTTIGCQ